MRIEPLSAIIWYFWSTFATPKSFSEKKLVIIVNLMVFSLTLGIVQKHIIVKSFQTDVYLQK